MFAYYNQWTDHYLSTEESKLKKLMIKKLIARVVVLYIS